jgi:hypothetical protein
MIAVFVRDEDGVKLLDVFSNGRQAFGDLPAA